MTRARLCNELSVIRNTLEYDDVRVGRAGDPPLGLRRTVSPSPASTGSSGIHAMAPSVDSLDSLEAELSRLSTTDSKLATIARWPPVGPATADDIARVHLTSYGTTIGEDLLKNRNATQGTAFSDLLERHGITPDAYMRHTLRGGGTSTEFILDVLPCAHVDAGQFRKCAEKGTLTCASCKLVRYCSKARVPRSGLTRR
jgi:hypothetical protein